MVTQKKRSAVAFMFLASLLFTFSLLAITVNASATTYPDRTEATIFGGHVKASIAYEKDHSANYTTIGDTVTVTTTLEKLDNTVLTDKFKQTSVIILFPDEKQGLRLKGEPVFAYRNDTGANTGKFVDPSKGLPRDIITTAFNMEANILYGDTVLYDGRMTEIPITTEYDDGPYDTTYTLPKLLASKGDEVTLSYQATVTAEALKNKEFNLHTAVFDSVANDFDWNSFLTTKMPAIQQLSIAFDEVTKNKQIEITDSNSYKTVLTGTWDGAIDDLNPELTINGKSISIPAGSFKADHTFSIPVDLTDIGKIGENDIHIKISDKNEQVAEDDGVITLIQTNTPPELKLSDHIANQTIKVTPTTQTFNIQGQWKDADSDTVSLYYRLNGQLGPLQEGISNQKKAEWTEFSYSIPLNSLHQGENNIEVYALDLEGAISNTVNVILDLEPGSVRFKSIPSEILFQSLPVAGHTLHSLTQEAVDVAVEDTTGKHDWTLTVQQMAPFADKERQLPASLDYQNGTEILHLSNNGPILLPTAKNNETDYALLQDEGHHFDLTVYPGAYVGNYQTELEWTIVKAP